YETLEFWKNEGLERVVLAREVSMEEVAAIRENTDIEIEAFIHGAMCISYSGRCTLSNHMSMRDANRGGCSQSCRWKYELFDMPFGTERRSKTSEGEVEEEVSMLSSIQNRRRRRATLCKYTVGLRPIQK
ncbi:peptidase U32 family protein, partial [Escherichia coli]|uniref:peptidase U32 family protein n=1 Tax=Escherichia coli TaxID=562 RepID=UPI001BC8C4BE